MKDSEVFDFFEAQERRANVGWRRSPPRGLRTGGGGGTFDDMEQRVAKLESDVGEIKAILGRLEPMIIRIDEQLRHVASSASVEALHERMKSVASSDSVTALQEQMKALPSKTFVITTVVAIVGLVIAAIAAAPYLRTPI